MRVTWWGHSSLTAEWAGQRVLFDPVLVDSIAHLRRRRGPTPPAIARQADVVVISHLHADHCHLPSLRLLAPGTLVVGPAGTAEFLHRAKGCRSLRCVEVVAGEEVRVEDLAVHALFAEHDDRRSPVSRARAQPLSYLITSARPGMQSLWFGGDTALHEEIARVAPVNVALVPVAGWGPSLGPGHLNPEQAAEVVGRLSAEVAIPIHYGTFWPRGLDWLANEQFLGPERRFAENVEQLAPRTAVHVLAPGETFDTSSSPDRKTERMLNSDS
jgi:L-ascorbate metabolism protein UlaG (beta-lactamase superfamily)